MTERITSMWEMAGLLEAPPQTTTQPTPTALHAYLGAQQTAHALLTQVSALLAQHQDTTFAGEGMVDWGHVGDINAIVEQLQQIVHNA